MGMEQNIHPRYINPLTDFGFKRIFGDEEIMREFLNDLIEPESPIVSLTFLDKEMSPESQLERGVIYDMRCMLESGEEVLVEMQNRGQDYFTDRISYYMARAVSSQGMRGDNNWKFDIHPVYGVFFMNFHMRDRKPCDIRHVAFMETSTHEVFTDKLQMWLIELPNYSKMQEADCKTNRDYWLYTLTHMETMKTNIPFQAQKPVFHKLENMADMAMLTKADLDYYHISLDSYRTNLAVMDYERKQGRAEGRAEGKAEGRAEGRAEGHAQGRAEGLAEGRAEGLAEGKAEGIAEGKAQGRAEEKLFMARNLKSMGVLPAKKIAEATGLTIDEVEKL